MKGRIKIAGAYQYITGTIGYDHVSYSGTCDIQCTFQGILISKALFSS